MMLIRRDMNSLDFFRVKSKNKSGEQGQCRIAEVKCDNQVGWLIVAYEHLTRALIFVVEGEWASTWTICIRWIQPGTTMTHNPPTSAGSSRGTLPESVIIPKYIPIFLHLIIL